MTFGFVFITAFKNETVESAENLSTIMLEDGSLIYATIMDAEDLEVVNTLDYPSSEVEASKSGAQDVGASFYTSEVEMEVQEGQSQSFPIPEDVRNCVICRQNLVLQKDPWSDFNDCISSTTESKMSDLLTNLLKPNKEIEYEVNFLLFIHIYLYRY